MIDLNFLNRLTDRFDDPFEKIEAVMKRVGAWHPDDSADSIICGPTGDRLFTDTAAKKIDKILDEAFQINPDAVYDLAIEFADRSHS